MSTGKALKPIDEVRQNLARMEPQFAMALPKHITPEKFTRIAMTALQNSQQILECNRQSIYGALMRSAQEGLLPDGREAAIVKFGNDAVFMPMVGGILKKARNSGELSSITAQIVYEKDVFRYWVDSEGEHLQHEPAMFAPDRGKVLGVYALAKLKDGAVYVEVMTQGQVEKIRQVSRSKDRGPWKDWPDEMAKKSAIRRLSKRLPMSTDLEGLVHSDDALYDREKTEPESAEQAEAPVPPAPKKSRLSKVIEAEAEPEPRDATPEEQPAIEAEVAPEEEAPI